MSTLKQRVESAVAAGYKNKHLAAATGKTSGAVSQWLSGDTKTLSAESAAGLAALTGWSATWWALGKGPKLSDAPPAEPHVTHTPADDPAALLQALATHINQVDPGERAALGAMFNTWVLAGGKPSMTAMLAELIAPPQTIAQETPRKAA